MVIGSKWVEFGATVSAGLAIAVIVAVIMGWWAYRIDRSDYKRANLQYVKQLADCRAERNQLRRKLREIHAVLDRGRDER